MIAGSGVIKIREVLQVFTVANIQNRFGIIVEKLWSDRVVRMQIATVASPVFIGYNGFNRVRLQERARYFVQNRPSVLEVLEPSRLPKWSLGSLLNRKHRSLQYPILLILKLQIPLPILLHMAHGVCGE